MSAFLVSKAHIDALVTVAIFGVSEASALSGQWHEVRLGNVYCTFSKAHWLGEQLWGENRKSIRARYPREDVGDGKVYLYPMKEPFTLRSAVEALKLVKCYEYQSCEHDGWEASDEAHFCSQLKDALINALPGYDAAPWGLN